MSCVQACARAHLLPGRVDACLCAGGVCVCMSMLPQIVNTPSPPAPSALLSLSTTTSPLAAPHMWHELMQTHSTCVCARECAQTRTQTHTHTHSHVMSHRQHNPFLLLCKRSGARCAMFVRSVSPHSVVVLVVVVCASRTTHVTGKVVGIFQFGWQIYATMECVCACHHQRAPSTPHCEQHVPKHAHTRTHRTFLFQEH